MGTEVRKSSTEATAVRRLQTSLMARQVIIKFVSGVPDLRIEDLHADQTLGVLAQRVRTHARWDSAIRLRFISSGRELYADDPITLLTGTTLHCVGTREESIPDAPAKLRPHSAARPSVPAPQLDWVDTLDPSAVLMWIFGAILSSSSLYYAWSCRPLLKEAGWTNGSENHSRLFMLVVMGIIYIIVFLPCFRSTSPVLHDPHSHLQNMLAQRRQGSSMHMSDSSAGGISIPARPAAPVPPGRHR